MDFSHVTQSQYQVEIVLMSSLSYNLFKKICITTKKIMNYYVCSYGGCGSHCLKNYLSQFGKVKHIHSKNPPDKLEYIGNEKNGRAYVEHFNGIKIPEDEIKNYKVIYIYKNPINAIYSRFFNHEHLQHIQCDRFITLDEVLNAKKDLYGIYDFYSNYTRENKNRNYKIICVNYNTIFDNIDELNKILDIKTKKKIEKTETIHTMEHYDELYEIYKPLIDIMNKNTISII